MLSYSIPDIKQNISDFATGNNINNLSSVLRELKIPLPPLNIQQKIVDEIEKIEKKTKLFEEEIHSNKNEIHSLLKALYDGADQKIRLSDSTVFSLSIGRRVLNSDLSVDGKFPVYSGECLSAIRLY